MYNIPLVQIDTKKITSVSKPDLCLPLRRAKITEFQELTLHCIEHPICGVGYPENRFHLQTYVLGRAPGKVGIIGFFELS